MSLLRRGKEVLRHLGRQSCHLSITWSPGGAATLRLIGKVDDVAFAKEEGGPARTTVGGIEPVLSQLSTYGQREKVYVMAYCSCLPGTRDEYKMRLLAHIVRDQAFNVDLTSLEGTGCIAARLLSRGQRHQNETRCKEQLTTEPLTYSPPK